MWWRVSFLILGVGNVADAHASLAVEGVQVIRDLGVQCYTEWADGSQSQDFVSWSEISHALILEAPFRMQFIFCLALERRNPPDPSNPFVILYPVSEPTTLHMTTSDRFLPLLATEPTTAPQ